MNLERKASSGGRSLLVGINSDRKWVEPGTGDEGVKQEQKGQETFQLVENKTGNTA